jgi:hypothetical protein
MLNVLLRSTAKNTKLLNCSITLCLPNFLDIGEDYFAVLSAIDDARIEKRVNVAMDLP